MKKVRPTHSANASAKRIRRWGEFTGVGKLSPHDLRRTAITRALDQGLSYRQVQMMTGHRDPNTVMRYDHGRENLELNAATFLDYDEECRQRYGWSPSLVMKHCG